VKMLLLMRHAQAAPKATGQRDFDRPLTEDGRQVAEQTGRLLSQMNIRLDRLVTSSSVRTTETAECVASSLHPASGMILLDELFDASTHEIEDSIRKQLHDDESTVLIVGHNPGIAGVMCRWAGQSLSVPPGTVTIFESADTEWCEIGSRIAMRLTAVIQGGQALWTEPSSHIQIPGS
jgi:phosphohistidine phosphatase